MWVSSCRTFDVGHGTYPGAQCRPPPSSFIFNSIGLNGARTSYRRQSLPALLSLCQSMLTVTSKISLPFPAAVFYRSLHATVLLNDPLGAVHYYSDVTQWEILTNIILICIMTWLGDALVVSRHYRKLRGVQAIWVAYNPFFAGMNRFIAHTLYGIAICGSSRSP